MLWTVIGILAVLWLMGVIISCTLSGPVLIVFLIISILFLLAALILVQIIMRKKASKKAK